PGKAGPWRWLCLGLTILIMAVAVLVASRLRSPGEERPSTPTPPPTTLKPLLKAVPLTLAPGIHYLGGLDPAVAYAVETSDGLVLIDTGLEPDASALKGQLADLRLDW